MHVTPEERARRAYISATTPQDGACHRLRARLQGPQRPSQAPWYLFASMLTVAAAALAIWVLRASAVASMASLPEQVQVRFDGEGSIEGTPDAPRLAWEAGTLHVSVDPNRGIDLTVRTNEALVRVVGTEFDVHREHFATEVVVDHGRVSVTCVGEPERFVTDGQRALCLPDDLPTLLRRVASLGEASAPARARLQSLDRAASMAVSGSSAHGELLAHRVRALVDAGRADEALRYAEVYVDDGHAARRGELLTFLVHGQFERRQCGVRSRLEQAVAALPPGPEWLLLASCLTVEDPERARLLLDAAQPNLKDAWADLASTIAARLPEAPAR